MVVGLGTGSTAIFATRRIAPCCAHGTLRDVIGFATSKATADEARHLGIPLLDDDLPKAIDVTIDGADEVDPQLDLIKGGGGALLREKIVAQASRREIIVVDESKLSPVLGTRWALPVEVMAFGWRAQARYIESLGGRVVVRQDAQGGNYRTDQGNLILDCAFGPIGRAAGAGAAAGGPRRHRRTRPVPRHRHRPDRGGRCGHSVRATFVSCISHLEIRNPRDTGNEIRNEEEKMSQFRVWLATALCAIGLVVSAYAADTQEELKQLDTLEGYNQLPGEKSLKKEMEKVPNQPVETIIVFSEAKPTSGAAPLTVAFTADPPQTISNPTYTWQFGDGGATSTGQSVSHTFTKPGIYKVVLKITSPAGDLGLDEQRIKVTP